VKRAEFLKWWEKWNAPEIEEMYKGDPHGAACRVMTTLESNDDGRRFWRRRQAVLSETTLAEWEAKMAEVKKRGGR
jgi:hypothetical protein